MKTKKVASSLPLLASIGLGIASLVAPFLLANHYIITEGKTYSVDSYLFFLWGKYYTVAGVNLIQSSTVMYDFGDYPLIVMMVIIFALIVSFVSLFAGRGIILNVKGREFKLKLDTNPVWFQSVGAILIISSYMYMMDATTYLISMLHKNNYAIQYGPSLDFLLGSAIALVIATLMTAMKFLKDRKTKTKKTDTTKTPAGIPQ